MSIAGFSVFATTIATKLGLNKGKKNPYKEAKLVHGKRAYIEFYAFSDSANTLIRKRVFCPAKFKAVPMVERWANNLLPQINKALEDGYYFKVPDTIPVLPPVPVKHNICKALKGILSDKENQVRYRTFNTYQTVYNKFELFLKEKGLLDIHIDEFTPANGYDYRNYLTGVSKNSNRTVNNNLVCLKLFFEGAIEKGYIDKNPISIKMLPETDSDQHQVFEPIHQAILEDYLKENDYSLFVFTRLMYYAFLRPNELRGLKVNHIDMVKKVIDIPGKIAKNRRTEIIPINKTLFVVLMEYAKMILVSGNNIFLFGKKMKADKIQMAMNYAYNKHKAALLACGLQDYNYTLYSWKHTGASRAYEVTKDILRLSKLLRHASTKETENYLRSIGVRLKSDPLEYDW